MDKRQVGGEVLYAPFKQFYHSPGQADKVEGIGNASENLCVVRISQVFPGIKLQQALGGHEEYIRQIPREWPKAYQKALKNGAPSSAPQNATGLLMVRWNFLTRVASNAVPAEKSATRMLLIGNIRGEGLESASGMARYNEGLRQIKWIY